MPDWRRLVSTVVLAGLVVAGCGSAQAKGAGPETQPPAIDNGEDPAAGEQREQGSSPPGSDADRPIEEIYEMSADGPMPDFEGHLKWLLCLKPLVEGSFDQAPQQTLGPQKCGELPPIGEVQPMVPAPFDEDLYCAAHSFSAADGEFYCYFDLPIDPDE